MSLQITLPFAAAQWGSSVCILDITKGKKATTKKQHTQHYELPFFDASSLSGFQFTGAMNNGGKLRCEIKGAARLHWNHLLEAAEEPAGFTKEPQLEKNKKQNIQQPFRDTHNVYQFLFL